MKGFDFVKEKIYTIPITEAFEEKCFCPFCKIYKKLSEEEVKYALGPAMMEPDYRAVTNIKGFCKEHIKELNSLPKALAMALVLESHLDKVGEALKSNPEKEKGLMKNSKNINSFINELNSFDGSCAICDKINHTFLRYIDTFIYMIDKNEDFLEKVLESDGFCMPHYTMILNSAKNNLSSKKFIEIVTKLNEKQYEKFFKYKSDVKMFIESFDYKNAGKKSDVPKDTNLKTSYFLNGEFEKPNKKLDDI